jgi:hypothetical protein
MKELLTYMEIQTPTEVWEKLLYINPIDPDEIFYEPFKGEGNLYNLVITNKNKYWTEINEGKDVFDFENKDEITCLYTNPPFKCNIKNAKGDFVYKNSTYYFLEYFVSYYKNLTTIGFLINAKSFLSLTPCRLKKLQDKGFSVANITILNTNYWWGIYYFVLFKRNHTNKFINIIEKTFTKKCAS